MCLMYRKFLKDAPPTDRKWDRGRGRVGSNCSFLFFNLGIFDNENAFKYYTYNWKVFFFMKLSRNRKREKWQKFYAESILCIGIAGSRAPVSCCMSICPLVMLTLFPWRPDKETTAPTAPTLLSNTADGIRDSWLVTASGLLGTTREPQPPYFGTSLNAVTLGTGTSFLPDSNLGGTYRSKNITKPSVSHTGILGLHQVSQLCVEKSFSNAK